MGKPVVIAGRTESSLKRAATEIGATAYYVLNVSNTSSISQFVKEITSKHPELDCLINNADVQRPFQILGSDYVFDLEKADQEIYTNIRGPMHLSVGIVPHFNGLPNGGLIMNVPPFSASTPSASSIQTQLRQAGSKIKVVEIAPPTVETALHRERKEPDDNKKEHGSKGALSVEEFMEQIVEAWKEDKDICTSGMGKEIVGKWYEIFGGAYAKAEG